MAPPASQAPRPVDSDADDRQRRLRSIVSGPASAPMDPAASAAPAAADAPAPEAPPQAADPVASLRRVRVVVYTTGWCSVCKRAKAWMSRNGVAYEERNIEGSDEYARMMRAINPRGSIPTFDVEGDVMVGFSEDGLVATMQRAAARQGHSAL
jgi:glutaredoxin